MIPLVDSVDPALAWMSLVGLGVLVPTWLRSLVVVLLVIGSYFFILYARPFAYYSPISPVNSSPIIHRCPRFSKSAPRCPEMHRSDVMKEKLLDANFPHTPDGRTYHVAVKYGEVANRIVTVGDPVRARRILKFLDPSPKVFEFSSQRGFTTFTGCYSGVPISIVAIGMGYPMIDFFLREVRAVVKGDLIIIRFGSCGTLVPEIPVGSLVVCSRSLAVSTNYDHFRSDNHLSTEQNVLEKSDVTASSAYLISKPIGGDQELHDSLTLKLKNSVGQEIVFSNALHVSADTFYASQGRLDSNFLDENENLLDSLSKLNPAPVTMEMETNHFFHLAAISRNKSNQLSPENLPNEDRKRSDKGTIRVAAVHFTLAGRVHGDMLDPKEIERLEFQAGKACLETLINQVINPVNLHPTEESVWY